MPLDSRQTNPVQLIVAIAFVICPLPALAGCLTYEREAALTGMLRYETKADDRAERVVMLDLAAPVCIEGQGSDRVHVRREGVSSVQLVLPPELVTKASEKNRAVTAVGTLSGRVTGNPRIPVLLRVKTLRNAP